MRLRLSSIDPNNNARELSLLGKFGLNKDPDISASIPSMINSVTSGNVPTTRLDTSSVTPSRMNMRVSKIVNNSNISNYEQSSSSGSNKIFNRDKFISTLAKVESGGKNLPPNKNGYEGVFQFRFKNQNDLGSKIAKELGVTPEQYRKDVNIQKKFVNKAVDIYEKELTRNGLPVTNYTMWLVHNQGISGAKVIYNNNGSLSDRLKRNILNQFGEKEKKKLGLSINTDSQKLINAYENKFRGKFANSFNFIYKKDKAYTQSIGSNNTLINVSNKKSFVDKQIDSIAKEYGNAKYIWGGTSKKGIDCSGLTQAYAKKVGVKLPKFSDDQYKYFKNKGALKKDISSAKKGDIVFFKFGSRNKYTNHTAIYVGRKGDKIITLESSKSGGGVMYKQRPIRNITGIGSIKNV